MKRLWGSVFTIVLIAACGGKISGANDGGTNGDGNTNVTCCPPSPQPACCMSYGGAAQGNACSQVCDGMPSPGDPGWKLSKDSDGCSVWIQPSNATSYCGQPPPPPPPDAGACTPTLGPWSAQIDPPFYSHAGACTTQQISDIYGYCFTPNADQTKCQSIMATDATCASCLITPRASSKWGALLTLPNGVLELDIEGCIALTTSNATCAQSESNVEQCDEASCEACFTGDQQSFQDYTQCMQDADTTTCAKYHAALCANEDAGAAASCFASDFKSGYFTFAPLFCGQ